jgi:hypothetical protein
MCGRFCGNITGEINELGIRRVYGTCTKHGEVDLTHQEWTYEEFDAERNDGDE